MVQIKRNTICFVCIYIMTYASGYPAAIHNGIKLQGWTARYGTVAFPKVPELYKEVHKGDVYSYKENLYLAKMTVILTLQHKFPHDENELWKVLKKGTFIYPKNFNENIAATIGDIFVTDAESPETYYSHLCNGTNWPERQGFTSLDPLCWEKMDVKSEWMTLLRPIIGKRRLGDLVIPETHDTGTSEITTDSVLVDKNPIFELGMLYDKNIPVNWSITHDKDLGEQLKAGYRVFDLRIADLGKIDGTFRWWHGLSGANIEVGLKQLADFAKKHPGEVIIPMFNTFAAPGENGIRKLPIPRDRLDVLCDVILKYLGPHMVPWKSVSTNPTIDEILTTKRNMLVTMQDGYIRQKHPGFWEDFTVGGWSAKTDPEQLFFHRTTAINAHRVIAADKVTRITVVNTPNEKTIIGGFLKVYGDDPIIRMIIEAVAPEYKDLQPEEMSFEGLYTSLLVQARDGTNTKGMHARPPGLFTSGGSVQYQGVNSMLKHWLSRPSLYKVNIVAIDDCASSRLVDLAISANKQKIPRAVTIAFQGNPRDGYFYREGLRALGGKEGLNCTTAYSRYKISSDEYAIDSEWHTLEKGTVTFLDGQHPPDSMIEIEVSSSGTKEWVHIFRSNIQAMIEKTQDVYIRSSNTGNGHGFAYISEKYNDFGLTCNQPPPDAPIKVYW